MSEFNLCRADVRGDGSTRTGGLPGMTAVYIADSDVSVAESIAFLLRSEAISSRVFMLGEDLLQVASDSPPCCIVVDSQLPDMSGMRLLRQLRVQSIQSPVILLSTAKEQASTVDALKGGAWDYLQKPFMQAALVRSVKSATSRRFLCMEPLR